jgi:hemolysin-activating ACP:hemolysin acyltransferase
MDLLMPIIEKSIIHKTWSKEDIERLFYPPLIKGYFVLTTDGYKITGLATYGFFSDEAYEGYKTLTRKIQPEDFDSGSNIVLVDALAPFGTAFELMYYMRKNLRRMGYKGKYIKYFRNYLDSRIEKRTMI